MRPDRSIGYIYVVIGIALLFTTGLYVANFNKLSTASWNILSNPSSDKDAFDFPSDTLTNQYLSENKLGYFSPDQSEIDAFIEEHRGSLYTPTPQAEFNVVQDRGSATVADYLNSISTDYNPNFQRVTSEDIEKAFQQLLDADNPAALEAVIAKVERNEALLKDARVPVEVAEFHSKYLGTTRSLINNLHLMRKIDSDYVAGLIGARNVDDLVNVFGEIAQELQRLEEKHNL